MSLRTIAVAPSAGLGGRLSQACAASAVRSRDHKRRAYGCDQVWREAYTVSAWPLFNQPNSHEDDL